MLDPIDALFAASQTERQFALTKDPPTLSINDEDGVGSLTFVVLSLTNFELGKSIPARSKWTGKVLKFEATPAALEYLRFTWPDTIWPKTKAPEPEQVVRVPREIEWEPRYPPFKHQQQALDAAYRKKVFAFLMDMGTGKTKTLIDEMAELVSLGELDRALIVAPNGVHRQWVEEQMIEHWPQALPYEALAIITGKKFDPQPLKRPWCPHTMTLVAVNIEALQNIPLSRQLEEFMLRGRALMAVDESQKIKNPQAARSKNCVRLGRHAEYRRILTGSPMAKGVEDYYSQFLFLDRDILGINSMAGFKRQYCNMGGFEGRQIVGYRNTEQLHRLIAPHSFRVEKSEVLDLPPKMYSKRVIETTPEQKAAYREIKRELEIQLSDGTILQAEAMVQMLRLQQVACGYLPREDGTWEDYGSHLRLEALDELVQGARGKVVIWCRFRRDIDLIMEKFGKIAVRYDGAVNSADRELAKAAFMDKHSSVKLFVSNAQAGGAGLNLAGLADTVVYYSNSFSSLDRWQSEDRTHRIGTRGTVTYYDLVARGTIDSYILANLRRKKDISSMSLVELKSMLGDSNE